MNQLNEEENLNKAKIIPINRNPETSNSPDPESPGEYYFKSMTDLDELLKASISQLGSDI